MAPEREVIAVTKLSQTPLVLAVGMDNQWSFNEASNFSGTAEIKIGKDGLYHCELNGDRVIKLYWGKKLEYEEICLKSHTDDSASITAVEFSDKNPYGKGIASLDMNSKISQVNEEWFILPWATLSLVFMDMKESNSTKCSDIGSKTASCTVNGDIESKSAPCTVYGTCLMGSLCFMTCVGKHIPEAGLEGLTGTLCYAVCTNKGGTLCSGSCVKPVGEGAAFCDEICSNNGGTYCTARCITPAGKIG